MSRKPAKPKLYFSLRSPFSWMALRRLEERFPQAPEVIEYIPYWDPDQQTELALKEQGATFHYTQMSKAKHLYILQDTKRLTQRFGYRMTWPIDIDPWWEVPHLGWLAARRTGQERRLYAALTAARWERGENICERDVLRRVAEEAGLDPEPIVAAVDDPDIRAEGTAALVQAYEDDVFGIPYFKLGRHRFWGLDRLEDFLRALDDADLPGVAAGGDELAGIPAEVTDRVGALDRDTAGGCG